MATTPVPVQFPLGQGGIQTTDFSKLKPAGVGDDPEITAARDATIRATEDQIKALEQRYEQPNWFKMSAAFAKPQLGGFLASLGSAAEVLGENVEGQRAIAPTVAQMRAQVSGQREGLIQRTKGYTLLNERKKKPGGLTSDDVADIAKYDEDVGKVAQQAFTNQTATFTNLVNAIAAGRSDAEIAAKFQPEFLAQFRKEAEAMVPGRGGVSGRAPIPPASPVAKDASAADASTPNQADHAAPPKVSGRVQIPGVDVNSLTENAYQEALKEYTTVKQEKYKSLANDVGIQANAGKSVYNTAQQIHDLAADPALANIFAMYEKGNGAGTIGQMLESQSLSSTLQNVREYAKARRLGGGDGLTKLNNLVSLMGNLQNDMQNAVINPTDERTRAEIASLPNLRGSQDAFLRNIRYIANEGLTKYETQKALDRAKSSSSFDPFYWTSSPEFSSVNRNASKRRDLSLKTPFTQDRPSWMRGPIDEVAYGGEKKSEGGERKSGTKSTGRLTAKELLDEAKKPD